MQSVCGTLCVVGGVRLCFGRGWMCDAGFVASVHQGVTLTLPLLVFYTGFVASLHQGVAHELCKEQVPPEPP